MGSYETRLARLERRLMSIAPQKPLVVQTPQELEEWAARLMAKLRDGEAEDARRKLLPLEEQIELLEADRERDRHERANWTPDEAENLNGIYNFGDVILQRSIAELRERLEHQRDNPA